jgi:hypothetical protein
MLKNSLERRRRQHGEARSLPSLLKSDGLLKNDD